MSSPALFTPSLRYTNKDTCNSAWTFIDGQNVSDIEVPKFIKNLFTSFDDSRYGKMGKDLIEGANSCHIDATNSLPQGNCSGEENCMTSDGRNACSQGDNDCQCMSPNSVGGAGDPCQPNPCAMNSSCNPSESGYTCVCNDGFYEAATTGGSTTCTACTPVLNASSVTCSGGGNSRATCRDGFYATDNSTSNSSDTCTQCTDQPNCEISGSACLTAADHDTELICQTPSSDYSVNDGVVALTTGSGNITCTKPSASEIPDNVNEATLPQRASFSSTGTYLRNNDGKTPSCAAGYSDSPTLTCSEAGEYHIGGCETEEETTYTCSSAFDGATTGKDQPCNLSAPDSAGWTKGQLKGDPLWAKFNQATESTTLMEDQWDAIKALITNNSSMDDSGNPEQMNNEVWNKCCIKAECTDAGWNDISLFGTDGSWAAWAASLGCILPSLDTSGDPQ